MLKLEERENPQEMNIFIGILKGNNSLSIKIFRTLISQKKKNRELSEKRKFSLFSGHYPKFFIWYSQLKRKNIPFFHE